MAKPNAMKQSKNDSPMNCHINWPLSDPMTFLTPISLALFKDRAIDRLIKLMQAINNMKMAIPERNT